MLQGVAGAVLSIVHIAALVTSLYALVHAALQRPDAYTAVDKLTKPVWLVILAAALLLAFIFGPGFGSAIAACAAGVYLVDVRPKLLEIQGKSH
jgi:succinate dehydrogenase/fumarate reductase cytochrome b subunit